MRSMVASTGVVGEQAPIQKPAQRERAYPLLGRIPPNNAILLSADVAQKTQNLKNRVREVKDMSGVESLKERVDRLLKQAEDASRCPVCQHPLVEGACQNFSCPSGGQKVASSQQESNPYFADALLKAASTLEEMALGDLLDYSDEAQLASIIGLDAELRKLAEKMENNDVSDSGRTKGPLENTHKDNSLLGQQQPQPFKGREVSPTPEAKLLAQTQASPLKKALFLALSAPGVKTAAGEAMAGGAPPQAPPAAPQAPPQQPIGQAPAAPPQQDPVQIAMQLQAQGNLTPESLAQAAGISLEEAASIISSLVQGGSPQPPPPQGAQPQAGGQVPPQGPPQGAPPKQGSYDPAYLFQQSLRKYAEDGSSPLDRFIGTPERARSFTVQEAEAFRKQSLRGLFDIVPITQVQESGRGFGLGKMDERATSPKAAAALWAALRF